MSDTLTERLDAALVISDGYDFLAELASLAAPSYGKKFADLPEPLSWFGSVFHLFWTTTNGDQIWSYLEYSGDLEFSLALDACRRMNAHRTVAYLEAVAALYPRGRVPQDEKGRYSVYRRLYERARNTGTRDPFAALDERFADAMPTLPNDVRAWIVANRGEVDALLRNIPESAQSAPSELELLTSEVAHLEKGLVSIMAMSETLHEKKRRRLEAIRVVAQERGMLPCRDEGLDPRFERFFEAAGQFGQAEWLTVAKRALAAPPKFGAACDVSSELMRLIEESDLVERDAFRDVLHASFAVRNPVVDNARTMPRQVVSDGKPIGLLSTANDAIIAVSLCLAIHDWMMLTPEGVKAARVLYGLFDGLAPCPEIPAEPKRGRRRAT